MNPGRDSCFHSFVCSGPTGRLPRCSISVRDGALGVMLTPLDRVRKAYFLTQSDTLLGLSAQHASEHAQSSRDDQIEV